MNIKNFIKKHLKKCLLIFSITFLSLLVIGLWYNRLSIIDQNIYNFIIKYKSPFLTFFFKFITYYASGEWFIILCILVFFFYKDKKFKIVIPIYIVGIGLITILMKNIFVRVRPFDLMIIEEVGYSFPSGHSSASIAFYGLVAYLIYKSDWQRYKKILIIVILLLLSLLIGISRIYLGVHYPSDVLAGFMVGIIYFVLFVYIYNIERRVK